MVTRIVRMADDTRWRCSYAPSVRERVSTPTPFDLFASSVVALVVVTELASAGASVLALLTGAALAVPLIWRRRAPLAVLAGVLAGTSSLSVVEPDGEWVAPFAAVLIALYSVAAHDDRRRAGIGLGAVLLFFASGTVLDNLLDPGRRPIGDLVYMSVLNTSAWGIGRVVQRWREQALALAERTAELERERAWREQAAVVDERNRIARELHDVISHSVTLMVVQASAAEQVLPTEPERALDAILMIQHTGREAVDELRRLLGVLRPDEGGELLGPQPGLGDLPSMIARAADAGVHADVRIVGPPRVLAPGIELTAYRVVQEALTNVVKHVGPTTASVVIGYEDDALAIEVVNGPSIDRPATGEGPGHTGRRLAGMRERVALYGGDLHGGPSGCGFAVRARIPLSEVPT